MKIHCESMVFLSSIYYPFFFLLDFLILPLPHFILKSAAFAPVLLLLLPLLFLSFFCIVLNSCIQQFETFSFFFLFCFFFFFFGSGLGDAWRWVCFAFRYKLTVIGIGIG